MERFGLVGLPNAGKSSLYNALTGGGALATRYAFSTRESHLGVAKVPDHRLDALAEMSESRKVVNESVELVDIGGLVVGASRGEGLGNQFLAGIREVDAIVYVLRAFVDEDVPGSTDPLEQIRVLELELALADLEGVEGRGQTDEGRAIRQVVGRRGGRAGGGPRGAGRRSTDLPRRAGRRAAAAPTTVVPADEQAGAGRAQRRRVPRSGRRLEAAVRGELASDAGDVEVLSICAQIEAEVSQLEPAERKEMFDALGLGEGALPASCTPPTTCWGCARS